MSKEKFNAWWTNAKLLAEFRGCTMPAAYAAWLAGAASIEGKVVAPDVVEKIAAEQPVEPKPPAPKQVGVYRGGKGGKEKQVDTSPETG